MGETINYIYTLSDPRDNEVRYVGTTLDPKSRYEEHMYNRNKNSEKNIWISELLSLDLKPIMTVIDKLTFEVGGESRGEREKLWILHYLKQGARLFNKSNLNLPPPIIYDFKEQNEVIKLRTIAKAAKELYYVAPPANTTVPPAHVSRYEAALCNLYDALEDANLLDEQQQAQA